MKLVPFVPFMKEIPRKTAGASEIVADQKKTPGVDGKAIASMVGPGGATESSTSV